MPISHEQAADQAWEWLEAASRFSETQDPERDGVTRLCGDAYPPKEVIAFIETHIEQGPQLELENLPVGVVSAITGIERHRLTVHGLVGHAGTVPTHLHQDALCRRGPRHPAGGHAVPANRGPCRGGWQDRECAERG